jgi:hypothetical protein
LFFFSSFFPLRKIFVRFFSFLIWNFFCYFKKISSLISHFFSTIFSFLKLVCSFWQIARLQEFFLPLFIPVTMQTQILQENGYCKIETLLPQENSWKDSRHHLPPLARCCKLSASWSSLHLPLVSPSLAKTIISKISTWDPCCC